jgi:hypothetical protein
MRRLALALLAFAATIVPAFAYDTPEALLKALYSPYSQGDSFDWSNWDEAKFRSQELNDLFAKDLKEADGEVGRIDFDPYVDGQDYQISDLKFGKATITGDSAKVEVTFKNFEMEEDMVFTLIKEADGWKVDDVKSKGGADPYDLKDILTAPLVQ